ncbi:MAG: hypothetical protein H7Y60_03285 [Rhodospirillaceae bacterium]|nr:hypothetical protein [Rhodospirillales bacterium]
MPDPDFSPDLGEAAEPVMLSTLADSIAGSASDPEEAVEMCRDLANAENLDADEYMDLVGLVESATGWDLPEEGERL